MPKFGLKCFLGSFIFSLAAVFAVTKLYFSLSEGDEQREIVLANVETKSIELFAENNESDRIEYLYNKVEKSQNKDKSVSKENTEINAPKEETAVALLNIDDRIDIKNDILYMPEDDEQSENTSSADDNILISMEDDDEGLTVVDKAELDLDLQNEEKNEELEIADASEAQPFMIPLKHNFNTGISTVSVSSRVAESQIAMASKNVTIDNLGLETQNSDTQQDNVAENESYDDPWEVATSANKYIAKNTLENIKVKSNEVATLEDNKPTPAQAENETKEAYQMVKNLLIPIPEDIMNDGNLTPKLAYSEENKKLDKKLRRQSEAEESENISASRVKVASAQANNVDENEDKDEKENKKVSKSLTDSIAEWFSGSSKTSSSNEDEDIEDIEDVGASTSRDKVSAKSKNSTSSSFRRLLGLTGKNKGITPTELKLSFQPNRAEISGQTLEWLHAFSDNVIKNENVIIEIRIDGTSSRELQQKRLNLLYTILANNGVEYNKINIIFTEREPNSFIIRNVRYATEEELAKAVKKADNPWY